MNEMKLQIDFTRRNQALDMNVKTKSLFGLDPLQVVLARNSETPVGIKSNLSAEDFLTSQEGAYEDLYDFMIDSVYPLINTLSRPIFDSFLKECQAYTTLIDATLSDIDDAIELNNDNVEFLNIPFTIQEYRKIIKPEMVFYKEEIEIVQKELQTILRAIPTLESLTDRGEVRVLGFTYDNLLSASQTKSSKNEFTNNLLSKSVLEEHRHLEKGRFQKRYDDTLNEKYQHINNLTYFLNLAISMKNYIDDVELNIAGKKHNKEYKEQFDNSFRSITTALTVSCSMLDKLVSERPIREEMFRFFKFLVTKDNSTHAQDYGLKIYNQQYNQYVQDLSGHNNPNENKLKTRTVRLIEFLKPLISSLETQVFLLERYIQNPDRLYELEENEIYI